MDAPDFCSGGAGAGPRAAAGAPGWDRHLAGRGPSCRSPNGREAPGTTPSDLLTRRRPSKAPSPASSRNPEFPGRGGRGPRRLPRGEPGLRGRPSLPACTILPPSPPLPSPPLPQPPPRLPAHPARPSPRSRAAGPSTRRRRPRRRLELPGRTRSPWGAQGQGVAPGTAGVAERRPGWAFSSPRPHPTLPIPPPAPSSPGARTRARARKLGVGAECRLLRGVG